MRKEVEHVCISLLFRYISVLLLFPFILSSDFFCSAIFQLLIFYSNSLKPVKQQKSKISFFFIPNNKYLIEPLTIKPGYARKAGETRYFRSKMSTIIFV